MKYSALERVVEVIALLNNDDKEVFFNNTI